MRRALTLPLVLCLLPIVLLTWGCQQSDSESVAEIADQLWSYSLSHPDGFTVEIPSIEAVSSGFAVAYYTEVPYVGEESLTDVVSHALSHDRVVGGWLDTDDGIYYFDSVCIFDPEQESEAYEFAVENLQKAYYDLTNELTIYVQ